ncbi:MAG: hypothetical protein ACRD5K_01390 [Candidatus Acidiferrales bacterium]
MNKKAIELIQAVGTHHPGVGLRIGYPANRDEILAAMDAITAAERMQTNLTTKSMRRT